MFLQYIFFQIEFNCEIRTEQNFIQNVNEAKESDFASDKFDKGTCSPWIFSPWFY